jgi:nucleoside-triphosphatase
MPRNFFITGLPKAGKTTLLRRLIDGLRKKGMKVCGFITPEHTAHGTREGFYVQDLESGKITELASVKGGGPTVGKYHVNVSSFESVAVPAMKGVDRCDVLIIDEIGRMELRSKEFTKLLEKAFDSSTPVVASIHEDYVPGYAGDGDVLLLTQGNREAVLMDLMDGVVGAYGAKKAKKEAKAPAKPAITARTATKPAAKAPAKTKETTKPSKAVAEKPKAKSEPQKKEEKKGFFGNLKRMFGI